MKIFYSDGVITLEEIFKVLVLNGQSDSIIRQVIKNKEVIRKAGNMSVEVSQDQLQLSVRLTLRPCSSVTRAGAPR